jgi:hypothetical protein
LQIQRSLFFIFFLAKDNSSYAYLFDELVIMSLYFLTICLRTGTCPKRFFLSHFLEQINADCLKMEELQKKLQVKFR